MHIIIYNSAYNPPPPQDPFNTVWMGADDLRLADSLPGMRRDVMVTRNIIYIYIYIYIYIIVWAMTWGSRPASNRGVMVTRNIFFI